jgi:hypothetical protein
VLVKEAAALAPLVEGWGQLQALQQDVGDRPCCLWPRGGGRRGYRGAVVTHWVGRVCGGGGEGLQH